MHISAKCNPLTQGPCLWGSTKFRERGRNVADELTSFPQTHFPTTTTGVPSQNVLTEVIPPVMWGMAVQFMDLQSHAETILKCSNTSRAAFRV